MSERRYSGDIDRLQDPQSVKMMEIDKIIALSLDGIAARTMLDIGTGSGVFAEAFQKEGLTVSGIDVNPKMIEAAKTYLPGAVLKVAPAEAIPWENNFFDLIFMGFLLHEADDYVKTLKEAARVGCQRIAILEFPKKEQPFGPPLHHRLSEQQVRDFAQQAGLGRLRMFPLTHLILYIIDL